jgi:hypothetical protein
MKTKTNCPKCRGVLTEYTPTDKVAEVPMLFFRHDPGENTKCDGYMQIRADEMAGTWTESDQEHSLNVAYWRQRFQ